MDQTTWLSDVKIAQQFEPLKYDLEVDVLIIGAGITGITTAYLLSAAGKKVALIERSVIGQEAVTSYTTAFITQEVDTTLVKLLSMFSREVAKKVWTSHKE